MNPLRRLMSTVLKGFVVIAPMVIVGSVFAWFVYSLESMLGWLVRKVAPGLYAPGMGIALAVALSFAIGLLMGSSLARRIFAGGEGLLRRIPLVKTLYGSIQDLASLLSTEQRNRYDRVVLVSLGDSGIRLFGFVTREDLSKLAVDQAEQSIAVYLPMSYQIGGYLALVPRSKIEPVHMSIEDASRLVFTAAMSVGEPPVASPSRP